MRIGGRIADNLHNLIWLSRPMMQAADACVEAGGGEGQVPDWPAMMPGT
jgi:hypothetical protein